MGKEEKEELVHKVTLSTGKVVLLRDMKIKHQELAMKAVGDKAGSNNAYLAILIQKELLKILIFQVNDKQLKPLEVENLDDLFSMGEFNQLSQALGQLMGGGAQGEFQFESVLGGSK